VSIVASSEVPKLERCYGQHPLFGDLPPEFRGLFDMPSLCQNGTELQRTGAGSGFLVSADGYIVTNRHVVSNEQAQYTVVLNDEKHAGEKLTAKVVARHPSNDIAVLKIDVQDVPFLSFGDSSTLQVGQTAIAIGYALGEFDNTVSKGVVSGLARSIYATDGQDAEQLRGLIQTDAAINPGNSGGPLLDIAGKVIGMNTAVANAQNIGFAIPANSIRTAFEQARSSGTITEPVRPFLGVRYVPITEQMKKANNLPYGYGVIVSRGKDPVDLAVIPGSPADKAGIQENDILLEVDGKQLNERYDLIAAIENKKPGDVVTIKVFHKGKEETLKVTLEKK
jgi:serine protease Do